MPDIPVADYVLNPHEVLRFSLSKRQGKLIMKMSRWKTTANKFHPTGEDFEFAARHVDHVIAALAYGSLIADVESGADRGNA